MKSSWRERASNSSLSHILCEYQSPDVSLFVITRCDTASFPLPPIRKSNTTENFESSEATLEKEKHLKSSRERERERGSVKWERGSERERVCVVTSPSLVFYASENSNFLPHIGRLGKCRSRRAAAAVAVTTDGVGIYRGSNLGGRRRSTTISIVPSRLRLWFGGTPSPPHRFPRIRTYLSTLLTPDS